MEKISERKPETGAEEEIKKARNFLAEKLFFLPKKEAEKMETRDLFSLYQRYMDQAPTFENFVSLPGNESLSRELVGKDKKAEEEYRRYLLDKLPLELQKRQKEISKEEEEKEISVERLEKVHQYREQRGYRMILGYHCSNGEIGNAEGEGTIETGRKIESFAGKDYSGLTFYSTDREKLYGDKPRYLYLAEGDINDTDCHPKIKEWVFRHGPLKTRHKIRLSPELKDELGIDFVQSV